MRFFSEKEYLQFFRHRTKIHSLVRFSFLVLIIIGYGAFISRKFGAGQGLFITALTWSFFVFCTPIADAGFLLDFPVRLLTHVKMIFSEMGVWTLAFSLNVFTLLVHPEIYQKTVLLRLFYHIISQPWPCWTIILISVAGTFLSIYFGDELIDVAEHKDRVKYHRHLGKYQVLIFIFLIIFAIILYDFLLKNMGMTIPL
ncbi:MAG: hypothetical protein GXP63_03765 [DPANN group archaeon]|nr:hypothetical protein [DPANN group archaeon]